MTDAYRDAEGWTTDARCPHGVTVRVPIGVIHSLRPAIDPCEEARAERAAAALIAPPRRATLAEWRAARRFRRQLSEGVPWRSTDEPPG